MKRIEFSTSVTLDGSSAFVSSCFFASTASIGGTSVVIIPKIEGES